MTPKLSGMNVVCFDLEIKEPIAGEVTWARHDLMGISVGVLYDFRTDEYKVYMDDNLAELAARLFDADLVTGFNIADFDLPLIRATLGMKEDTRSFKVYDPLYWHRHKLGGNKFIKGLKLDDHLKGTFGEKLMKTGNGAEAPLWWKAGDLGRLVSYCIDDVKREKTLFEHIWCGQPVTTPMNGTHILQSPYRVMCDLNPGKYESAIPDSGGPMDVSAMA